jgi:hypothetical protein
MMDDDRCLSAIRGRSARDLRAAGRVAWSDSEPLEADEEELDTVGDKLGRLTVSRTDVSIAVGSGYAAVAVDEDKASDMFQRYICWPLAVGLELKIEDSLSCGELGEVKMLEGPASQK